MTGPQSSKTQSGFVAIEQSVLVQAKISDVFARWRRLNEFPAFMEGVREISWVDEKRFSLKSENDGQFYVSLCEVALLIPDRRMAWRTLEGPDCAGVACFEYAGNGGTEVTLKMRYDARTGWQNREQVEQRLRRNLDRFKELVEGGKPAEWL